jgi:hypothetical protein
MTEEQFNTGYVTLTTLDDGQDVVYGIFETKDKADKFGDRLVNYTVHEIYPPTLD